MSVTNSRPESPGESQIESRTGPYVLGDLIADGEFGLELVSGDPGCRARPIAGAQASEIDRPTRFLDRDWVVLMTGVGLSSSDREQRALVAELELAGIAALGFALDIVFPRVPGSVLDEARRRSFPMFTVPRDVAFRDVEMTVFRNVLSGEFRSAHRLAAIQRYLMDALIEDDPAIATIDRLAGIVDARVGVLRPGGGVSLGSEQLPGEEIVAAIGDRTGEVLRFGVGGHHGLALPIEDRESLERSWLVVATSSRSQLHPLAQVAAQAARPVLVAAARLRRAEEEHGRLIRRGLLDAMLEPGDPRGALVAAQRAAGLGIDLGEGVRALAIAEPDLPVTSASLVHAIESALGNAGITSLVSARDDLVCWLLPGRFDPVEAHALLPVVRPLPAGAGRLVSGAPEVFQSFSDAQLALQKARGTGGIVSYEEMSFAEVMLNEVSVGRLLPKVDEWLDPLYDSPILLETVAAYFANDLDVVQTAQVLSLHPNSVRYRLKRVEDAIGMPLLRPATIAALHVALQTRNEDRTTSR